MAFYRHRCEHPEFAGRWTIRRSLVASSHGCSVLRRVSTSVSRGRRQRGNPGTRWVGGQPLGTDLVRWMFCDWRIGHTSSASGDVDGRSSRVTNVSSYLLASAATVRTGFPQPAIGSEDSRHHQASRLNGRSSLLGERIMAACTSLILVAAIGDLRDQEFVSHFSRRPWP
jgi:hypothetical protein